MSTPPEALNAWYFSKAASKFLLAWSILASR